MLGMRSECSLILRRESMSKQEMENASGAWLKGAQRLKSERKLCWTSHDVLVYCFRSSTVPIVLASLGSQTLVTHSNLWLEDPKLPWHRLKLSLVQHCCLKLPSIGVNMPTDAWNQRSIWKYWFMAYWNVETTTIFHCDYLNNRNMRVAQFDSNPFKWSSQLIMTQCCQYQPASWLLLPENLTCSIWSCLLLSHAGWDTHRSIYNASTADSRFLHSVF